MGLEREIQLFNNEYGTKLTVSKLDNSPRTKLDKLEGVLFDKQAKNSPLTNYVSLLIHTYKQAVKQAIKENLKINEDAEYDISSIVNLNRFISRFEALMRARWEETESERERAAYEGANYKRLVELVIENTKEFDQALCWSWAEEVLKDKISYKDLKAVTDCAIADLDQRSALGQDEEFPDADYRKLANVYWAMRAMEMVRQQRGFWFAIFSFRINGREKEYYRQLVAAKDRYEKEKGFPVKELRQQGYESVMKYVYEEARAGVQSRINSRKAQKKHQEELRNMPKVVDIVQPRLQDNQLRLNVVEEILQKLPPCRLERENQRMFLNTGIMSALLNSIKESNEEFDEYVQKGNTPEYLLKLSVRNVFITACAYAGSIGYLQTNKQLVVGQVITDVIMKHYSAVLLNEEKYKYFAEGYVLGNSHEFDDLMGLDSGEPYVYQAMEIYNNLKREQVDIVNDNNQPNAPIAPPVDAAPQQDKAAVIKN